MTEHTRPDRLAAVFDYATDRAAYLDMSEAVQRRCAAYDREPLEPDLAIERSERILEAVRDTAERIIAQHLEDRDTRTRLAGAMVDLLPLPAR